MFTYTWQSGSHSRHPGFTPFIQRQQQHQKRPPAGGEGRWGIIDQIRIRLMGSNRIKDAESDPSDDRINRKLDINRWDDLHLMDDLACIFQTRHVRWLETESAPLRNPSQPTLRSKYRNLGKWPDIWRKASREGWNHFQTPQRSQGRGICDQRWPF